MKKTIIGILIITICTSSFFLYSEPAKKLSINPDNNKIIFDGKAYNSSNSIIFSELPDFFEDFESSNANLSSSLNNQVRLMKGKLQTSQTLYIASLATFCIGFLIEDPLLGAACSIAGVGLLFSRYLFGVQKSDIELLVKSYNLNY